MTAYRPWLRRDLPDLFDGGHSGTCYFIMLNPSTADDEKDDPTIRRCKGFAARLGLNRLVVINLFTARATDPADLMKQDDPVGPGGADAIERAMTEWYPGDDFCSDDKLICAWGAAHKKWPPWFLKLRGDQINSVFDWADSMKRPLFAIGFTADGSPRHPLYVAANAPLLPINRNRN